MVSAPDHQRGQTAGSAVILRRDARQESYGRKKSVQADINGTPEVFVDGLKNPSRSAAAESSSLATAVWKYVVECRGVVSSES